MVNRAVVERNMEGGTNKLNFALSEAKKTQKPTLSHVIVPTALKKNQQVNDSKVIVRFSFMSDFSGSQLQSISTGPCNGSLLPPGSSGELVS